MKILITGADGQLGRDCQLILKNHEIIALNRKQLDICQADAINEIVGRQRPDAIINCAAYTKVDDCEANRIIAWQINAVGPGLLAAAATANTRLFHISTDYVFDGCRVPPQGYVETDATNPESCYGASKLAGEEAIQKIGRRYVILRTAWLYGFHGRNFLKTILRVARQKPHQELRIINDQFGTPTWTYRLAEQIALLLNQPTAQGIYHATSEGYATWYQFAQEYFALLGVDHPIIPCQRTDYPAPAKRPTNSILGNQRLKEAGLNCFRDWRADLATYVQQHREQLLEEADKA